MIDPFYTFIDSSLFPHILNVWSVCWVLILTFIDWTTDSGIFSIAMNLAIANQLYEMTSEIGARIMLRSQNILFKLYRLFDIRNLWLRYEIQEQYVQSINETEKKIAHTNY